MTVKEAHYYFQIYLNKLNSNFNKSFTPPEIDVMLNDAQLSFIENTLFTPPNTEKNVDLLIKLSPLLVENESVTPLANIIKESQLDYPLYKYISYKAEVEKTCIKTIKGNFDYHENNLNDTQKPNFKWGIVKAYFVGINNEKAISFDVDGTLNKVYITYYKQPDKICYGYVDVNGNTLPSKDLIWDDEVSMTIVQKAAQLADMTLTKAQTN